MYVDVHTHTHTRLDGCRPRDWGAIGTALRTCCANAEEHSLQVYHCVSGLGD